MLKLAIESNGHIHFTLIKEQPKGPSDLCPRLNGFYAHPDPAVCHIFYACVDGQAEEYTCSSGLWFDEYSGVCNWPETTDRKKCKAEACKSIISLLYPPLRYLMGVI